MYNIYVFKHNYAYINEQELGSPLDIQMPLTFYYSFFFFTYFLILCFARDLQSVSFTIIDRFSSLYLTITIKNE